MLNRSEVERAERDMNVLVARIHETFECRDKNEKAWGEWKKATHAFHTYENSTFLLWQSSTLKAIIAGDHQAIADALTFLEADPYFFRSGYLKEKLLRALKRAPLKGREIGRLQMIVLRALQGRYKREFIFYSRLIPYIHTSQFENELRNAAPQAKCQNHARLVLNSLDNHC